MECGQQHGVPQWVGDAVSRGGASGYAARDALMSLDFLRSAVAFLMTPVLAALSIVDTAALTACSRSAGGAAFTFFQAVAMRDLTARFLAVRFTVCLSLFLADFLCGNLTLPVLSAEGGEPWRPSVSVWTSL
jgi:hypothetical protein